MRSGLFIGVSMKMEIFCAVKLCSLEDLQKCLVTVNTCHNRSTIMIFQCLNLRTVTQNRMFQ